LRCECWPISECRNSSDYVAPTSSGCLARTSCLIFPQSLLRRNLCSQN
jgi:hypothetical protein